MAIKVRVKLTVKKDLSDAKERFYKVIAKILPAQIIDFISKGISPVSDKRKYQKYSDSYKDQIKKGRVKNKIKRSPVTLKQSGALHKSLETDVSSKGTKFVFTDEKAEYHDIEGAGKKRVIRRLLPNTGGREKENFNRRLVDRIRTVFEKQIKRINLKR